MSGTGRLRLLAVVAVLGAAGLTACGERGSPGRRGRSELLAARSCSPSAAPAATRSTRRAPQGSATQVNDREYKDGPNFNQRKETKDQVLYAIENGGFSSGPMPQDIVTGEDARAVAEFVAKYSGKDAATERHAAPS